jgi:hypothetical protein
MIRVYLHLRRDLAKGKVIYGVTAYNAQGGVAFSDVARVPIPESRFSSKIACLTWALGKLKTLVDNKFFAPEEEFLLFISSKTLYKWLEQESAPDPYTMALTDVLLDLSFFTAPLEVIYSESAKTKTLFHSTLSQL